MYDVKSSVMPRERPHSLRFFEGGKAPFSRTSCVKAGLEVGHGAETDEGPIIIAGNCMLPTNKRTSKRKAVECLGARRDAASTVTVDHLDGDSVETREARGVQWRVVSGTGSVRGTFGVNWRKT